MLSLSTVLQDPALGLRALSLPETDPPIAWAHVSELSDPTPWLAGGELLLTTGLGLFRDAAETRDYCARLAEAGVAALGLSTGATLPHAELPAGLVDAAARAGIALVHVPEHTPLQGVVRFVSDSMHDEQTEPLRRALLAQRQLSEAATEENGIAAVLAPCTPTPPSRPPCTTPVRPLASSGPAAESASQTGGGDREAPRDRHALVDGGGGSRRGDDHLAPRHPGRSRGVLVAVKAGR